uniref:Uncharacterized protein n=1 Tax=Rhipicephalus zambeziensis TaxID=60191 RepID=A0A224YGE5_9ACAR
MIELMFCRSSSHYKESLASSADGRTALSVLKVASEIHSKGSTRGNQTTRYVFLTSLCHRYSLSGWGYVSWYRNCHDTADNLLSQR